MALVTFPAFFLFLYISDVEMKKPVKGHPEMLMASDPKRPLKAACFLQPREAQDRTAFHSGISNNGSTVVSHQENTCCPPPRGPAKVKGGVLTSHQCIIASMYPNTGFLLDGAEKEECKAEAFICLRQ